MELDVKYQINGAKDHQELKVVVENLKKISDDFFYDVFGFDSRVAYIEEGEGVLDIIENGATLAELKLIYYARKCRCGMLQRLLRLVKLDSEAVLDDKKLENDIIKGKALIE